MNYGIHTDMPAEVYHALPGASASQLRTLWQSTPAHLRASLDAKDAASPAMQMGTLVHAVILEPEKPLPGIVIQPDEYEPGKKWTNAARACKDWHAQQVAAGLMAMKASEYDAAFGMARSVASHSIAAGLLAQGRAEVSLVVHDATNALDVRARIDFVPDSLACLVDVKSTVDASERGFTRKAYDLGYHIQAALYLDLWNGLMPSEPRTAFFFVVVENSAPFAVNVFEASEEFLAKGREHYRAALATYARCTHEGAWPGYPEGIKSLGIPSYARA